MVDAVTYPRDAMVFEVTCEGFALPIGAHVEGVGIGYWDGGVPAICCRIAHESDIKPDAVRDEEMERAMLWYWEWGFMVCFIDPDGLRPLTDAAVAMRRECLAL